jgi:glyoxylase-like metal-dependent hydrolase (beta-lactamase superfamily II)
VIAITLVAALGGAACVSRQSPETGTAPAATPDGAAARAAPDPAPAAPPRPETEAERRARWLAQVPVSIIRVTNDVAMLIGEGGNTGVSFGEDGTFLVDGQHAPLAPRILAKLDSIGARRLRFLVVNTHWHEDHTGGNEALARAGAEIVAHASVRRRLGAPRQAGAPGDSVTASDTAAQTDTVRHSPLRLPAVTFTDAMTVHLNGDSIDLLHVRAAHTDGDVIVRWRGANVIHTGDIYVSGAYPLIDLESGGSLDGTIAAVDTMLALANAHTRIIPGHGPLSNVKELRAYRDMLDSVRARVRRQVAARKSLDEVRAAGLTKEWDEALGRGAVKPEAFIEMAFESVTRSGAPAPRRERAGRRRSGG